MPNDNIMGIKTKACVNGVYPDTIPTIQQDIANIEDDIDDINTELDNVVHKTGDEEINGEKTFTEDLTVHGDEVNTSGTVVLSPSSQGGIVQLKDNMNRPISIVHSHDTDGNCYLREYPDNYYPVDENENPVAPSNPTIMTSGLIAVDPRIVHTTGNETVAGNKTFTGTLNVVKLRSVPVSVQMNTNTWYKMYTVTPASYGQQVFFDIWDTSSTTSMVGAKLRIRVPNMNFPYNPSGNLFNVGSSMVGKLAKTNDGNVEIWLSKVIGDPHYIMLNVEYVDSVVLSPNGIAGNEPIQGDDYPFVTDLTVSS